MKQALLCLCAVVLLVAGCRKKANPSSEAVPVTPGAASDPASAPAPKGTFTPAPALPANSPAAKAHSEMDKKLASGNPQLQLQVLDDIVQAWVMSKGTLPKDLEELVKAKVLNSVPPAPPGKRFVIDAKKGHVVLGD